MNRNRGVYFLLLIITIIFGLGSRKFPYLFPKFVADFAGDTLYAVMIFFLGGLVLPKSSTLRLSILSLSFCYLIEISQVFHFEWLDELRRNRIGALVLGYGFLWSDIACYTFGIISVALIEILLLRKIK